MAEPWIKLRIHAEHPKVLRLASLLKLSKEVTLAMAVRWFRHVDAYLPDDSCVIDAAGINAVVQFKADANKGQDDLTFARGLMDEHVQWLADVLGGGYRIPEYDKHFSANAKRRGDESLRKKRKRLSAKCPQKSGQMSAPLSISSLSDLPLPKKEDATGPPRYAPPGKIPPTQGDCVAYAADIGMAESDAVACYDYWESAGWKRRGGPVRNWQATMRTWKANTNERGKSNGKAVTAKPTPQWLQDRLDADKETACERA